MNQCQEKTCWTCGVFLNSVELQQAAQAADSQTPCPKKKRMLLDFRNGDLSLFLAGYGSVIRCDYHEKPPANFKTVPKERESWRKNALQTITLANQFILALLDDFDAALTRIAELEKNSCSENNIFAPYKGHIGNYRFIAKEGCFYGTVQGISRLVQYRADTFPKLEKEFHVSVDAYLEICATLNGKPENSSKGEEI